MGQDFYKHNLGQILFVRSAFAIFGVLTTLVTLYALWLIWQAFYMGTSLLEGPALLIINIAIWSELIWWFWMNRMQGVPAHQVSANYSGYFGLKGRNLFVRALSSAESNKRQELSLADIEEALNKENGYRFWLLRIGISRDEIVGALEGGNKIAQGALDLARELAGRDKTYIAWDHVLKGLVQSSTAIAKLFEDKRITVAEALAAVDWTNKDIHRTGIKSEGWLSQLITPHRNLNKAWTAKPTPVLDAYSQNLTYMAKVGALTSAQVRNDEVEQCVRILARTNQNNLILVGEPGVGKIAIIHDLAVKLHAGMIPSLKDYKLISLDVNSLAAENNFESLFAQAINEASGSGNTLLYIGNLSHLVKGKTENGLDLSGVLVQALETHNLQLVGTTDPMSYKKYIENNAKLASLFSKVVVEEMAPEQAVLVLEDRSHEVEARQGVLVTLDAIKAAVELSVKLIHDAKLPDKAEDLLDEAAVYASRNSTLVVTREDVEAVMSQKTNIPVGELEITERTKLLELEDKIHSRMIGQDQAVTAVSEALKRSRLNISNPNRPIGSFLFLGPTGVGKTELAKSLAWAYFGDESQMIRLDMSEFQSRESIERLIGVSESEGDSALAGGRFTESVRQTPFAVILLDEIEKAHADVLNVFLQVLDEGHLTDSMGRKIDFTHTIIIATSNAQARYIQDAVAQGLNLEALQQELVGKLVAENFTPEFINRFDGVITFKPLAYEQIEEIAKLKLDKLFERLSAEKGITVTIQPEAIAKLVKLGYDPQFGARPLERVMRNQIESVIANSLLMNPNIKRLEVRADQIQ